MIPVNTPLLDGKEKAYLTECIESGWISSEGPFVRQFEEKVAERMERTYGIAVANGTAALEIAAKALGLGPGDEVIVPSFTIISPVQAITKLGAVPVLVDSDPHTWNMTAEGVSAKITNRTKGIIVVHIYGMPCDMEPLLQLAEVNGLWLLEDAAEMHGQQYKGRPCGSFGAISTLSFYPNKHITTGEGGMILTNNAVLADHCASLRNLCFAPERRFKHYELGWNYRMTNLQAAVGLAQMERLDYFVEKKRQMGTTYHEVFRHSPHIQIGLHETEYAQNIYWIYGVVLNKQYPHNAAFMQARLAEKGIDTRPFFYPMHLQPVFYSMPWYLSHDFPVATTLADRGFYIPSGLGLSTSDQLKVISTVQKVLDIHAHT